MTLLCLILAGGKSTRMGEDKALLFDSVNTLSDILTSRGHRVIVACGSEERAALFHAECWFDPDDSTSLGEVVHAFVQQYDEEIQLFPCDMYNLDKEAIEAILAQPPGVPIDMHGQDQFTLARIPQGCNLLASKSLKHLFSELDRNQMGSLGDRLENFNSPNQIDHQHKSSR